MQSNIIMYPPQLKIMLKSELEQNSEKWHQLRLGRITATGFCKLMSTAPTRRKYLISKAAEIITKSKSDSDCNVRSFHIDRGHEYEDVARCSYIAKNWEDVEEIGIALLGDHLSCSPDGLVAQDGMIEIKCPDTHIFLEKMLDAKLNNKICSEHYYQIQFNLFVLDRKWCDYILYNAKYPEPLFIHRVERDASLDISAITQKAIEELMIIVNDYNGDKK